MGVDYAYVAYPPDGLHSSEIEQFRLKNTTRLLHKYGLKGQMGFAGTPNNGQKFVDYGWMTSQEVTNSMLIDALRTENPVADGWPATSGVWMCMNAEKFRKDVLLDRMMLEPIDMSNIDASYLDIHTPLPCGNAAHGDYPVTVPVEGNIKFLEDFRDAMTARGTEGKRFTGHSGWAFNTAYSLMDFTIPGEFYFGVPTTTMINTAWNSMLFGIQVQFYTGEMDVSTPDFYQKVHSRANLAWIVLHPEPQGGGTSSFTYAERKMWIKYMTPLKIYDVENSILHHPYDHDYGNYAAVDTTDVYGIIYRRPGDILLVVTKEDTGITGTVQVTPWSLLKHW